MVHFSTIYGMNEMKNSLLLQKYFIENDVSMRQFSKEAEISRSTLIRIIRKSAIRIDTARKIEKYTQGKLKISDFDVYIPGQSMNKKKK